MTPLDEEIAALEVDESSKPNLDEEIASLTVEEPSTQQKISEPFYRAMSQFNIGLANTLGLPKVAADFYRHVAGYEEKSILPSSTEIQQTMANMGMTYQPGEEPDAFYDRIYQNLGASSIPMLKMAKMGYNLVKAGATEILASVGGAGGGKVLEKTEWGVEHPILARALGELGGGLGLSSTTAVKTVITTPTAAVYKVASAPFRGAAAQKRAVKQLSDMTSGVDDAINSTKALKDVEGLTASQRTTDTGIIDLRKKVEGASPNEKRFGLNQRSEVTKNLKKELNIGGVHDVATARQYLEQEFSLLSEQAKRTLQKAQASENSAFYSTQAKLKLDEAYNKARTVESRVWGNLPKADPVDAPNVLKIYKRELENITEGGDLGEISAFLKDKLGVLNKKKNLTGGALFNKKKSTATPKALHQFSARISREMRALSEQAGNTNKIRILSNVKEAVMKDLEQSVVGGDYKDAIALSRNLNQKFTSGEIGSVLGFNRGLATPETKVLDELIGSGGEDAVIGIDKFFNAAPKAKADVENFIRKRFLMASEDTNIGKINRNKGEQFLKRYKRLLDGFPNLKNQLTKATQAQKAVDSFAGVSDVSNVSPLVKERSAAGIFIGAEPGDEIKRIFTYGKSQGKTKEFFTELVNRVKKDDTGSALNGLKNSFTDELLTRSLMKNKLDPITNRPFVSGDKFLTELKRLKKPSLDSGLITKQEYNNLKQIGKAFKAVEMDLGKPTQGAIMTDSPGRVMDILARVVGAKLGGQLGAGSAGGSIQMASIGSAEAKGLINRLTRDEARDLLIRASRDQKVMDDLLIDVRKLRIDQEKKLFTRIKDYVSEVGNRGVSKMQKVQAPVTAVTPPIVSVSKQEKEELSLQEQIDNLVP